MGPPAHFEQFIAIGKIEAAPTELQIQTDDNGRSGHLTSILIAGTIRAMRQLCFRNARCAWENAGSRHVPFPTVHGAGILWCIACGSFAFENAWRHTVASFHGIGPVIWF